MTFRILFGILIFTVVILLIDWYLYRNIRVLFADKSALVQLSFKVLWWMWPFLFFFLFLVFRNLPSGFRNIASNIVFIVLASKLLPFIILLIGDAGSFLLKIPKLFASASPLANEGAAELISRKQFMAKVLLGATVIPAFTLVYGIARTAFDFKIHRQKLKFPHLPAAFSGFRMVQISDIHTGSLVNSHQLQKAVELINELNPDVILFTGDIVNNKTDEAFPYVEILAQLRAKFGVYSTLGNHDYGDYHNWDSEEDKRRNFQDMIDLHRRMGWNLMNNSNKILDIDGEKIAILGVENWGDQLRFPKYGKIHDAKAGTEGIPFKILMSHDPSHWNAQITIAHKDIDLTLSGHTHGFQFGVEIPGFKWSPSQYVYKQWAGLYENEHQLLYVNRGLGCLGYMGRVGIRPEITFIELEKA